MLGSIARTFAPATLLALLFTCGPENGSSPAGDRFPAPSSCTMPAPLSIAPQPILTVGNGTPGSCTETALRAAVDSLYRAGSGGTVRFNTGGSAVTIPLTSSLGIDAPDTPVVIEGGGVVTLDGRSLVRIFRCEFYARLVLRDLRLVNASADSSGAGVYLPWYGSLECTNVTFENNRCTVRGPEFGGGAIFAGGLDRCALTGCVFTGNSASNGGAILNRGTNLVIIGATFRNNQATGDGGGRDAGATGQGGLGGAVYIDGMNYDSASPFLLCSSRFIGNTSRCHGSAVFSYYYKDKPGESSAFINQCEFDSNTDAGSSTSAGTLYHEGAPLRLHACTFARNSTRGHAGAIFLGSDSPAEMVNCTFFGNVTPGNGGAIFGGTQEIAVIHCTFAGNQASYGPAIFNDTPDAVGIANTIFVNNVPDSAVNPYSYRNCTTTYDRGTNVIQWPSVKVNGNPDNGCIGDALFADPLVDSLASNGGATMTVGLKAGSPALGMCDSCAGTDQRGVPRASPCDAGAFERE